MKTAIKKLIDITSNHAILFATSFFYFAVIAPRYKICFVLLGLAVILTSILFTNFFDSDGVKLGLRAILFSILSLFAMVFFFEEYRVLLWFFSLSLQTVAVASLGRLSKGDRRKDTDFTHNWN